MEQVLPRVTILIANYNYGRYIKDCIDSAKNQTFNCSICVVDDCSTDNSEDIIKEELFGKEMTKKKEVLGHEARFVHDSSKNGQQTITFVKMNQNSGPSEARNIGIEATKDHTDFYCILDADDRMYPEKVAKMLRYACTDTRKVGVIYADYDILNEDTGVTVREYKEPFSLQRLLKECIVHSGAMISKAILETVKDENGYYDRHMRTCEDYDLWIRIARKFVILHIPEPLTLVINQKNNSTNTVDKSIWQKNWKRISEKLNNEQ